MIQVKNAWESWQAEAKNEAQAILSTLKSCKFIAK